MPRLDFFASEADWLLEKQLTTQRLVAQAQQAGTNEEIMTLRKIFQSHNVPIPAESLDYIRDKQGKIVAVQWGQPEKDPTTTPKFIVTPPLTDATALRQDQQHLMEKVKPLPDKKGKKEEKTCATTP
jgi:hypothetical protein